VTLPPRSGVSIGGRTRVAGIIGSPIAHSLSPAMHNAAYAACGLDWVFLAFEVPLGAAAEALRAARTLGLAGLSVTMPHKQDVAGLVDASSDAVGRLGAANTVVFDAGRTFGESTDGAGFIDSLRLDHQLDPAGMAVAVLGAGGAARAIILALADAGSREVVVVNRTSSKGSEAAALAGAVGRVGASSDVEDADLVVNATPAGMDGNEVPIDPAHLRPGQVVVDLVYHPRPTPLLAAASDRGCTVVDGLGMLVHQGARQFTLWTGEEAPIAVMRAAADAASWPGPS
jgi:shikimate dehydrogenase